jgi:hypothetical protein
MGEGIIALNKTKEHEKLLLMLRSYHILLGNVEFDVSIFPAKCGVIFISVLESII